MAKYQTPGIYIEETPLLPPEMERGITTAVFIGYTEKHEKEDGKNLLNIPTKVKSIIEFEKWFGKAQIEENIEIIDNSSDENEDILVQFNSNQSLHNLYYSILSYFENGGNSCTIVSVGTFKNIGETLIVDELIAGLNSLDHQEENLLINVPEDQNLAEEDFYFLQKKILEFCEIHRGFSILNLPKNSEEDFLLTVEDFRIKTDIANPILSFGAVFMPNLVTNKVYSYDENLIKIKKPNGEVLLSSLKINDEIKYQKYLSLVQKFNVVIPPTGAVSGAMIYSENTRGIWKAPANINLNFALKPTLNITNREQDSLNIDASGKSINSIRTVTGKGTLIWGSRTLNGNDHEWKYISIRRFANLLESDIQKGLKLFTFEPNDSITWNKITATIENYLYGFWREGALAGAKPEHAYFVRCGKNTTMSDLDILENRLIVQIGIAPSRPMEFVIFELKQKMLTK